MAEQVMIRTQGTNPLHMVDAFDAAFERFALQAQLAPREAGVAVLRVTAAVEETWMYQLLRALEKRLAASAPSTDEAVVYWRDVDDTRVLSVGAAVVKQVMGPERFEACRAVVLGTPLLTFDQPAVSPRWFLGAAFAAANRAHPWEAWPDAQVLLPRWTFERRADGEGTLTSCFQVDPAANWTELRETLRAELTTLVLQGAAAGVPKGGSDPAVSAREALDAREASAGSVSGGAIDRGHPEGAKQYDGDKHYMDAVAKTAEEIAQGQYTKAVLARRATTVRPPGLTLDKVLQALTNRYPNTFVYAFHGPGAWFVGASPERLVRVEAGQVTVDCLAGTVATGADDAESEALFAQLFNSRKDRAEHQVVVRSVTETLASVLAEVNVPAEPSLKKLQNVQHLWTEVRGRVRPGVTALDLAARLHPTPAVAGVPRDVALQVIAARESMDRGWYAGPIGWLTASGDGEFAVALRSALFKGDAVHLYAGAGIMGDSQPAAELRETELKLQAVRNAIFEEHA